MGGSDQAVMESGVASNGHGSPAPRNLSVGPEVRSEASHLDAIDVSAWFGDTQVLDAVSLSMPAATVTALIGPSGCGKSTFLRILNRMHESVPGAKWRVRSGSTATTFMRLAIVLPTSVVRLAWSFRSPTRFRPCPIADNVAAGLALTSTKISKAERAELVETNLVRAGLWNEVKDRLSRPGAALSGGQQQRLCIARALAVQPEDPPDG